MDEKYGDIMLPIQHRPGGKKKTNSHKENNHRSLNKKQDKRNTSQYRQIKVPTKINV
jgi:hypothetical protein